MSFSGEAKSSCAVRRCSGSAVPGRKLMACCCFAIPFKGIRSALSRKPGFAARLPKLFHKAFGLAFDRMPEGGEEGPN